MTLTTERELRAAIEMHVHESKDLRSQLAASQAENERLRDAVQDVICDPGNASLSQWTKEKLQSVRVEAVQQGKYIVVVRETHEASQARVAELEGENSELKRSIVYWLGYHQMTPEKIKSIDGEVNRLLVKYRIPQLNPSPGGERE